MKRVLYLLLLLAACKSSSSEKEVDRIALITEKVLNEDFTTSFRPETFEGDVARISEVTYKESRAADGYVKKDTVRREYLFKDHRLHQIATVTARMSRDTLTVRYDTAGRILAIIRSDDRNRYCADTFKYDAAGRRIERMSRFYSTENRHLYEHNKTGDSILIRGGDGKDVERICISEKGGVATVTRELLSEDYKGGSYVYEYDGNNRPVKSYLYLNGLALAEVIEKYDSHRNLVRREHHNRDASGKGFSTYIDDVLSNTVEYTYDSKGNWEVKKEQRVDKKWTLTKTRKITYR